MLCTNRAESTVSAGSADFSGEMDQFNTLCVCWLCTISGGAGSAGSTTKGGQYFSPRGTLAAPCVLASQRLASPWPLVRALARCLACRTASAKGSLNRQPKGCECSSACSGETSRQDRWLSGLFGALQRATHHRMLPQRLPRLTVLHLEVCLVIPRSLPRVRLAIRRGGRCCTYAAVAAFRANPHS